MLRTLSSARIAATNRSKGTDTLYVIVGYPGNYSVMTYGWFISSSESVYITMYCGGKEVRDEE